MAIIGMKEEYARGPNGSTMVFFNKIWKCIKESLLQMVQDFNKGNLDLRRLNYGVITLVPKVKEANTTKQYQPICLLNLDFKKFSKMLTDRITPLIDRLISESQSGNFIKGRNILQGVVILHKVIHKLKTNDRQGVLFKIGFEKAYDKVRWSFVQKVIERKGFPREWIKNTMSTVQDGRVRINVNGGNDLIF
jgi:hypothetical protein